MTTTETTAVQADFEEFVRTRSDALFGTALLLTGDRHTAEDLLQTTLAQVWRRWGTVHTSHEGVVRRAMVNTYVTWWRRRWKGERPTAELPERAGEAADHDAHLDLRDAVRRLPRRQRAVVVLRYFEDLPEAEVAAILGCSVGTVKSQAHRALAKLRDEVGRIDGSNSERYERVGERVRASRLRRAAGVAALVLVLLVGTWAVLVSGDRDGAVQPAPAPDVPALRSVLDEAGWESVSPTGTDPAAVADVRLVRGDDALRLTWYAADQVDLYTDDLAADQTGGRGTVQVLGRRARLYQSGATYQLIVPPRSDSFLLLQAELRRVDLDAVLAALRTDAVDAWVRAVQRS